MAKRIRSPKPSATKSAAAPARQPDQPANAELARGRETLEAPHYLGWLWQDGADPVVNHLSDFDADGHLIHARVDTALLDTSCDVTVVVRPGTHRTDAATLLRKMADAIEREGLVRLGFKTFTGIPYSEGSPHPVLQRGGRL